MAAFSLVNTVILLYAFVIIDFGKCRYTCIVCSWTSSLVHIPQNGWTPIISAADNGQCDAVMELMSLGADFNAQSNVS